MKTFVLAVCFVVLVPQAGAQTASDGEDIVMLRDSVERERIRRSERAAARRLDSANKTTVSQLPSTTAVCS